MPRIKVLPEATDISEADTRDGKEPRLWTFLTNHTHVLVCLSMNPDLRGWEIARQVGITERATQKIVADLAEEGYLTRERIGRRNRYTVNRSLRLRHPLESDHTVGELLDAVMSISQLRDQDSGVGANGSSPPAVAAPKK